MHYTKRLAFFTVGYDQVAIVFPILVAAPRYFAGEITLGGLTQISNAFGQVQGSLSWFVDSYSQLAGWKASVDRLLTFQQALERSSHRGGAAGRPDRAPAATTADRPWSTSTSGCRAGASCSPTRPSPSRPATECW